ncbi:hypothetical protein FMEAI12_6500007 [Parafrankia sp. Ea1.12]|nr:hypothetical protein FMEAI12_6500007 [Parafrankia sp. Ea1.12]
MSCMASVPPVRRTGGRLMSKPSFIKNAREAGRVPSSGTDAARGSPEPGTRRLRPAARMIYDRRAAPARR